jgi:HK97 family phage major capsid protein
MSEFVKSQQEVRANLTEQIREVIDLADSEKRGLSAEELQKIDRIEDDIRRADEAIAVATRNEERAVEASAAAKGFQIAEPMAERSSSEILREIAATRGAHTFERRTMVPSTDTVPKSFFDQVFDVARLVGPMLDVGNRINTTSGEDITIPTLTAYSAATLKAAGSAIAESEPTYSSITLGAYKYGLLIPVSNELIADAGFDISSHLANQAGNGLGFAVNAALTTGTGSSQPNGVVTAAGSGVTGGTGVSGGFTADNLIDLQYTLDGAARRLPGVAYMAAGASIGAMRKLKDDAGQYLYQVNVGQPDSFAGYNVIENPGMTGIATDAKSVLFGHMPSYQVRVAGGVQVATSTDYAFNTDSTVFRVLMRVDGDLTHASHIKYFKGGAS